MVDSEPVWWMVERALAREHGHRWTDAMAESCVGTGLPNTIATMRRCFGITLGDAEGVAWLTRAFIARRAELELEPGCRALLDAAAAAGLPLAVASSSTAEIIAAVLDRFSLAARFAAVVSGEQVPKPKPAPDIFVRAAEKLGRTAGECVVLEDSRPGVRAAVAAAMRVIAVPERDVAAMAALTPHVAADLYQAAQMLGL